MTDPRSSLPAPTGVPQPFEVPASAAPTMPAPTSGVFAPSPAYAAAPNPKRPVLSTHGRIAAWLVLAVKLIFIVNRFIPYSSERLEYYFDRFTDVMFWTWLLLDLVIVVFLFLYVRLGIKPLRYVAAAIVLVDYFIILPVWIHFLGGDWLIAFTPPEWEVGEVVASLRSLFMWVLKWLCVVSSFVMVIPDRKAPTVSQQRRPRVLPCRCRRLRPRRPRVLPCRFRPRARCLHLRAVPRSRLERRQIPRRPLNRASILRFLTALRR